MSKAELVLLARKINELHDNTRQIQEHLVESWSAAGSILTPLTTHHRKKQREQHGISATDARHMVEVAACPDAALAEAERLGWNYRFTLSRAASAARRAAKS